MHRKNYYGNDSGVADGRQQWTNNGAEARIALSVIYLFTPPHVAIDHVTVRPQTRDSNDRWTVVLIKIARQLARDLFKCLRTAVCARVCVSSATTHASNTKRGYVVADYNSHRVNAEILNGFCHRSPQYLPPPPARRRATSRQIKATIHDARILSPGWEERARLRVE